jgi:FolB domain-containing protein
MTDQIHIEDLEVRYCVGVPDEERAQPQRLLVCLTLYHDFSAASEADDVRQTVDYYALTRRLLQYGEGRSWRLIETLAVELAELVLREFGPVAVEVEVKKFILPETRWVSVKVRRLQPNAG